MTRTIRKLTVAAGMLAVLTWSASAWAQQDRRPTGSHRAPEAARSAPAQSGPRAVQRGPSQARPPQAERGRQAAPPNANLAPQGRMPETRGYLGPDGRTNQSVRGRVVPQAIGPRGGVVSRGELGPRGEIGRAVPRTFYAPRFGSVGRPYYAFRPQYRLGGNFFVGFAVPFPSWYDPYGEGYGYDYGYGYGGLSFDVQPPDAAVYIDGRYAGLAGDFTPYDAPLTVVAGRHVVEITAAGYQPLTFDISVVAGEVLPYQGTLGWIR